MIKYVVQPGDMLGVIAVKYKTTLRTLINDNPIIPRNQILIPGWILKIYTPGENARRDTEKAYETVERAHNVRKKLETTEHLLKMPQEPFYYKERPVIEGQVGFVKILKPTDLIEIQANGYQKKIRQLGLGELLRVFDQADYRDGFYLVDGDRWVTTDPEYVRYEPIPLEVLRGKFALLDKKIHLLSAKSLTIGPKPNIPNYNLSPTSYIGSGPPAKAGTQFDGLSSFPVFERPDYKRPVLQMKNAAGEATMVELRVLGFSANYSNSINPSSTNAGWMINIGANNLPVLNISGFLMETKAHNEFDEFMKRYHKYLSAARSGDYYSMGISTLFYKQTEYKGLVVSFGYSDREDETLHRKYNLQMLVLKEKSLSPSEIRNIKAVVPRSGKSEKDFRSDIASMLHNTITGKTFSDFF